jgi:hypothetical protein
LIRNDFGSLSLLAPEKEFRAQLNETGRSAPMTSPKYGGVIADIAVHGLRSKKLSVVESIETF